MSVKNERTTKAFKDDSVAYSKNESRARGSNAICKEGVPSDFSFIWNMDSF